MNFAWANWMSTGLLLLDMLIISVLLPVIIMQRRESGATLAWVLAIIFLPFIGLLSFWLLGTTKLYFRRRKRIKVEQTLEPELQRLSNLETPHPALTHSAISLLKLAQRLDKTGPIGGNSVTLHPDGKVLFDTLEAAFDAATQHIHALYYIWETDTTGTRLRDALVRAAQRGVEVRILVDDVGSRHANRAFFKPLTDVGGQTARFLKIHLLSRRITLNNRNHRKIVVIDGQLAFTGGMNVGNEYAGLAEPWRDLHVRIHGTVTRDLQETFCQDWFHATNENLVNPTYFPAIKSMGNVYAQFLASGPADKGWQSIYMMLFTAMTLATKRIWLETPYFIPDRPFIMALQTAALRGVDVRILLPAVSDHALVFYAGRSFVDDLLRAGAHIFEYPAMLHAKAVMVDSHFATIGSTNMDQRSFRLNFEGNLFFYDSGITQQLQDDFVNLCENAQELTLLERRKLPKWERFKENSAQVLAPLL